MIIDFDEELAKEALEFGIGEIRTRSGKFVRITDWDYPSDFYPIRGIVRINYYSEYESCWSKKGKYSGDEVSISYLDLFIEITKEL